VQRAAVDGVFPNATTNWGKLSSTAALTTVLVHTGKDEEDSSEEKETQDETGDDETTKVSTSAAGPGSTTPTTPTTTGNLSPQSLIDRQNAERYAMRSCFVRNRTSSMRYGKGVRIYFENR
jgi:hypothetical protein